MKNHKVFRALVSGLVVLVGWIMLSGIVAAKSGNTPALVADCPQTQHAAAEKILDRVVEWTETEVISRFEFIGDGVSGSCGWWMHNLTPRESGFVSVTVASNMLSQWWNWWVIPNYTEIHDRPNPPITANADEGTFWWYPPEPTATPTATNTSTPTPTASPTITATASPTPTASPTITATASPTPTASPTATNKKCPTNSLEAAGTILNRVVAVTETSTISRFVFIGDTQTGSCGWKMSEISPTVSGFVSVTVWSNVKAEWWNWWEIPNHTESYDKPVPAVTSSSSGGSFWWYKDPECKIYFPLMFKPAKPMPIIPPGTPKCPTTAQEAAATFTGLLARNWFKEDHEPGCIWYFVLDPGETQTILGIPSGFYYTGWNNVENKAVWGYGPIVSQPISSGKIYKINP